MSVPTLQERITQAKAQGRMARIPFITAGFPDLKRFLIALRELDDNGADIIEIGIPFSDPVADGPVVEAASRTVLEAGITLEWVMAMLRDLKPRLKAGVVLMGYYNPFLQYGLEKLARDAAAYGVQGCVVPDLPLGEDDAFRAVLSEHGLDLIALVGINTNRARMEAYAKKATGFVYVVSVMGTTGVRQGLSPEAAAAIDRARAAFSLPIALGFGIQKPEQVEAMDPKPDAVVFGSALLRHLSAGGTAAEFMRPWAEQ